MADVGRRVGGGTSREGSWGEERGFRRDVPYVPTDEQVVRGMLKFAGVGPGDVVMDLGCGDGRIVIGAARWFGARGVGVDVDPQRMRECDEAWRKLPADVQGRVTFEEKSFFDVDLSEATVVTLYLLPKINVMLRPKLMRELRTGARIIANSFAIGDWQPDSWTQLHHRKLMKWVVPAFVEGRWRCVLRDEEGERWRMVVDLERRHQVLTGEAWCGRRVVPVGKGKVLGKVMKFHVPDPVRGGMDLEGTVEGGVVRGEWRQGGVGGKRGVWWGRGGAIGQ